MAVSVIVNNPLTLVHKISSGISMATIPDVCKTPTPAGPVPIPYPNISMASDLMKGPKSIKAEGVMPANYGSEFMKSTGDEPGTAGGVVSSTFIKESTWMTFSFDVKLEGKGAIRLTDKKFQNHMNTVNAAGVLQAPNAVVPGGGGPEDPCDELRKQIEEFINTVKQSTGGGIKGLKQRFDEQINGPNGPPGSGVGDPKVWETHDKAIKEQQSGLRRRLNDFNSNNCGPPPEGAWDWATKPAPSPKEWQNPNPVSQPVAVPNQEATKALAIGGGVIVGLIVVSRIIRLLPPLWPLQLSPI